MGAEIDIPTALGGELRALVGRGADSSAIASAMVSALAEVRADGERAFPVVSAFRVPRIGDQVLPLASDGALEGAEVGALAELAKRLRRRESATKVCAFEEGALAGLSIRDDRVSRLFGLRAESSDAEDLAILAFSRAPITEAGVLALELFVLRAERAFLDLRAKDREADLVAHNERLQRTQRAILNVIDDLREARATLEERVRERTRRLSELLEERDAVLAKEQRARVEAEAARAQAESANRMKDEFLSTVSHELRTPLTAIVGWAQLLRGDRLTPDKRAAGVEVIERNARAQVRLVEDLLDFGRIIQGKFRLAVGPVEVVRVVEAALESIRPAADAKDVRIQRTLDSHATIVGDGERLQQVVWNLLSNAIKFTPKGGRVHVTLRRASSYVELAVADTGDGIAPEFLAHVFEPFRQADGSTSRRSGGLGLGLSIVNSLVELHGGTVTATSDGVGKGATFTVRIPVAPVRASIPDGQPSTSDSSPEFDRPAALDGVTALVVDDEIDTRELVAYVLEQCGVKVTLAGSSEQAIARLDEQRFDVLVSDVGMPGEDGLALLRRVRERAAESGGRTPALALTAYSRSEDRAAAIRAGFDSHLAKPVDPSELTLTIAALVRNQRR